VAFWRYMAEQPDQMSRQEKQLPFLVVRFLLSQDTNGL